MEIERKFLVLSPYYRSLAKPKRIAQGYLNSDKNRTVRVRIQEDKAWLTVKSITVGISRQEFEYEIPLSEAEHLLELCEQPVIKKDRYTIYENGFIWEVDEFRGPQEGLVIAEIELPDENMKITPPAWMGKEVSHDPKYFNSNLGKVFDELDL